MEAARIWGEGPPPPLAAPTLLPSTSPHQGTMPALEGTRAGPAPQDPAPASKAVHQLQGCLLRDGVATQSKPGHRHSDLTSSRAVLLRRLCLRTPQPSNIHSVRRCHFFLILSPWKFCIHVGFCAQIQALLCHQGKRFIFKQRKRTRV